MFHFNKKSLSGGIGIIHFVNSFLAKKTFFFIVSTGNFSLMAISLKLKPSRNIINGSSISGFNP
jgi:hypothetical protein